MMISGDNFQCGRNQTEESYYFSRFVHIWGWATWRRAWRDYDVQMREWPLLRKAAWLQDKFGDADAVWYWRQMFDAVDEGRIDTWDAQLVFSCWAHDRLAITPSVNLVTNIGFGESATHTKAAKPGEQIPAEALSFPLRHPPKVAPHESADRYTLQYIFLRGATRPTRYQGMRQRLAAVLPSSMKAVISRLRPGQD